MNSRISSSDVWIAAGLHDPGLFEVESVVGRGFRNANRIDVTIQAKPFA
jgi:hypothetical protein